jgi:hypothetical protein
MGQQVADHQKYHKQAAAFQCSRKFQARKKSLGPQVSSVALAALIQNRLKEFCMRSSSFRIYRSSAGTSNVAMILRYSLQSWWSLQFEWRSVSWDNVMKYCRVSC